MARFTISAEARITVCPDGYECFGRRLLPGGIADFAGNRPGVEKVISPKTDKIVERKITNLSKIWRSLIRIANITAVAGDAKIQSDVIRFCDEFGVPRFPEPSSSSTQENQILVSHVIEEAYIMRNAFSGADGNFIQGPKALDDAIKSEDFLRVAISGEHRSVDIEGALFGGWFDLINGLRAKPTACDFCGGLNVSRKKSRFCSDFCRDKHHKQILRS